MKKQQTPILALAMMIIMVLIGPPCACAEEKDFFSITDNFLHEIIDMSDRDSAVMSASGYPDDTYILAFDFTDGNQTIVAIAGDKCKVYYFFEDEELMQVLFRMTMLYDEFSSQIPESKAVMYRITLSQMSIFDITTEDILNNYNLKK